MNGNSKYSKGVYSNRPVTIDNLLLDMMVNY
jgi:hypothetical protein